MASLLPCDGPSMAYTVRSVASASANGPHDRESMNRLCHNTTGGPVPVTDTCSRPRSLVTNRLAMTHSLFTSESETSVSVVSSSVVAKSSELPTDRLAIGQLLVRLLRLFRDDLAAPA